MHAPFGGRLRQGETSTVQLVQHSVGRLFDKEADNNHEEPLLLAQLAVQQLQRLASNGGTSHSLFLARNTSASLTTAAAKVNSNPRLAALPDVERLEPNSV